MTERVMNTDALQAYFVTTFQTKQVLVRESNSVVTIEPLKEKVDCTIGLRGMFKDCPEMSVDKFLERKHADKELDL
ncbi:MAG: hypothetical protein LBL96_01710 [Clostridiales bacterium]|jgi:virulence-associated protein VagC|nr:hypothetical protein [Clostridiales bacterium]